MYLTYERSGAPSVIRITFLRILACGGQGKAPSGPPYRLPIGRPRAADKTSGLHKLLHCARTRFQIDALKRCCTSALSSH
jgi:hypothetical protein